MTEAEARDWAMSHTRLAVAALEGLPGDASPLAALAQDMLGRII